MPLPKSNKPRVMVFNNGFFHGGTERQFVRVIENLDQGKYELFVGCLQRQGPFLSAIQALGIPIVAFPIRSLYGLETMYWFWRLVQFLRRNRIAVLHAFDFYTDVFAVPAARLAGVPVVLASRRELLELRSPLQRSAVQAACWLATGVVANSLAAKADLCHSGFVEPEKVTVIHNGIDSYPVQSTSSPRQIRKRLGIAEGAPLIALAATLRPEKDVDTFLRAAVYICEELPEARFLIIGDGSERQRLEHLSQGLGLSERALFLGDQSNVEDFLAAVDVCVLSSRAESLPNAVLEAMTLARPVVATNSGGTRELVKDGKTGFLVPVRDSKAMAQRILELVLVPSRARTMGEEGRRCVEGEFSCARMKQEIEALYDTMLYERCLASDFQGFRGANADQGLS